MFGKHVPDVAKRSGFGTGTQYEFKFANGYGASVIDDGYGKEAGLYELAVLDATGYLDYSTPITDDVVGHLTADDVAGLLDQIAALSAREDER